MINFSKATSIREFEPYRAAVEKKPALEGLYKPHEGRLCNKFSIRSAGTDPIVCCFHWGGLSIPFYVPIPNRLLMVGDTDDLKIINLNPDRGVDRLKCFILTAVGKTPVYIFDEHQFALYCWREAMKFGKLSRDATLVNFDKHADLESDREKFKSLTLETAFKLGGPGQEGDDAFIIPAIEVGIFRNVYWVKGKQDWLAELGGYSDAKENYPNCKFKKISGTGMLEELSSLLKLPSSHLALSIDSDFFATFTRKDITSAYFSAIYQLMRKAGVVTIATSPGYINQNHALKINEAMIRIVREGA